MSRRPGARIAIDITPLVNPRAGVARYVDELLRSLVPRCPDVEFHLVSQYGNGSLAEPLGLPGTNWRAVFPRGAGSRRFQSLLLGIPTQKLLTLERYTGPVDLFHGTNAIGLPQRAGRRVVTMHDLTALLFPRYHPHRRVFHQRRYLTHSLQTADAVIAVSEATRADILRHFAVPPEKVTVIPLAAAPIFRRLDDRETGAGLSTYGLGPGSYLLYVGTLEPRKNLIRLLEAYALVRARAIELPLVLAGRPGWGTRPIQTALARSRWSRDIKVLGFVPDRDLPALYSGARLVVYPSLYEGFGLPVLEAMACGTPTVTSNTSSLAELAAGASLLVDPRDVEALAGAVTRLVQEPDLRAELSRRGLERAGGFTWEATAGKTLEVYSRVLDTA